MPPNFFFSFEIRYASFYCINGTNKRMREELLRRASALLERRGFTVFQCTGTHACFDLVARRGEDLFLIKALENIDSFTSEQARDLDKLSFMFNAKSMILGESTKEGRMDDGVLYERQGVPAISFRTMAGIIEGELPDSRKCKILSVSIDGAKLSEARRQKEYSLEDLSLKTRISKETLYRYEHEQIGASEENICKLERVLEANLRKPIDPFNRKSKPADDKTIFSFLGFKSIKAKSAPFDIAAKERKRLFAGEEADRRTMKKRARIYQHISKILESSPCFLLNDSKEDSLEGIPIIRRSELKEIKRARELLKLLEERGE